MEKEYRIIFYFDSRYNTDRYVVVGGNFVDANNMIKSLEKLPFASNVSRYWVVDRQFVNTLDKEKILKLKTTYRDLGNRSYWEYKK